MWNNKTLSVIFPTYREEESIYQVIEEFRLTGLPDELIVVNNNATPKTILEVKKTPAIILDEPKQGYGFAIRKGLENATGDYIVIVEPDRSFRAEDLSTLLLNIEDFDVVLGSRTHKGYLQSGAMNPLVRIGNIMVARFAGFLFNGPKLNDAGCTFRIIKREALKKIMDSFSVGGNHFSMEFIVLCLKNRFRIIMVPVHYYKRIGKSHGASNLWKAAKIGLSMLAVILKHRLSFKKGSKKPRDRGEEL